MTEDVIDLNVIFKKFIKLFKRKSDKEIFDKIMKNTPPENLGKPGQVIEYDLSVPGHITRKKVNNNPKLALLFGGPSDGTIIDIPRGVSLIRFHNTGSSKYEHGLNIHYHGEPHALYKYMGEITA